MNNDLISREALKEQFNGVPDSEDKDIALMLIDNAPTVSQINIFCKNADEKALADMKEELQKVIDDLKPQGEWIEDYTAKKKRVVACNKCHCLNIMGKSNFCPNCGADMRGEA